MYDEHYLIKRYFVGYPWALVQYSFDSYLTYSKRNKRSYTFRGKEK